MNKIISFDKTLDFKTMVGEICSISLEPFLKFDDDTTISGNLKIFGKYKLTSASRLEEAFSFTLPVDIVLTECLEEDSRTVEVDDFRYKVVDDESLECHIDLKVSGVEKIEEDDREVLEEVPSEEMVKDDIFIEKENNENVHEVVDEALEDKKLGLFSNLQDNDDSFSTYYVYIVRDGDSISSIMDKYHVSREDLEKYNDIDQVSTGDKILIPSVSHD